MGYFISLAFIFPGLVSTCLPCCCPVIGDFIDRNIVKMIPDFFLFIAPVFLSIFYNQFIQVGVYILYFLVAIVRDLPGNQIAGRPEIVRGYGLGNKTGQDAETACCIIFIHFAAADIFNQT